MPGVLGVAQESAQGVVGLGLAQAVEIDDRVDGMAAARQPLPQPLFERDKRGDRRLGGRAEWPERVRASPSSASCRAAAEDRALRP